MSADLPCRVLLLSAVGAIRSRSPELRVQRSLSILTALLVLLPATTAAAAPPAAVVRGEASTDLGGGAGLASRVVGTYTVGPGDVLQVQVYGEDGLTGSFPVNDLGALDFPLLGSIPVGGLSSNQVAAELQARLRDGFIRDAVVTVWIEQFGSQPVQVLGAVDAPGTYYARGPMTLMQLLSEAGGMGGQGATEVRLTRGGTGGQVEVFSYDALLREGAASVQVRGGDVVFVPESLVYVTGKVADPGPVPFRADLTVSRCLAAAGGPAAAANLGRVYILRGEQRIRVNVRRIQRGKAPDVTVQAGDQIFVQESVF